MVRLLPLTLAALVVVAAAAAAATIRLDPGDRRAVGTPRADHIIGTFGADRLYGGRGGDRIVGGWGADALFGQAGADRLSGGGDGDLLDGGAGGDRLAGEDGDDRVIGRAGDDHLAGGEGGDRLAGGPGIDRFAGGAGDDRILTRDGRAETVVCGEGDDVVRADRTDRVAEDCEVVSPEDAKPVGTTRARPFPFGSEHPTVDGWGLQVLGTIPDATAAVLAENIFNEPPAPGSVFSIARVRATRTAPGAGRFDGDYRLRAVGPSNVIRATFVDSCGVIPDELPDPDVFAGGAIEGNVCWEVPAAEAASLLLVDEPFLAGARRFYAMR